MGLFLVNSYHDRSLRERQEEKEKEEKEELKLPALQCSVYAVVLLQCHPKSHPHAEANWIAEAELGCQMSFWCTHWLQFARLQLPVSLCIHQLPIYVIIYTFSIDWYQSRTRVWHSHCPGVNNNLDPKAAEKLASPLLKEKCGFCLRTEASWIQFCLPSQSPLTKGSILPPVPTVASLRCFLAIFLFFCHLPYLLAWWQVSLKERWPTKALWKEQLGWRNVHFLE